MKGDAYFSDGTNEEITIKKMTDADGDELSAFDKAGPTATKIQAWFSYTIDSNDKYSLKQAKTTDTPAWIDPEWQDQHRRHCCWQQRYHLPGRG